MHLPPTHLHFHKRACIIRPDFCFRFHFQPSNFQVHELRHGILQALPEAKSSYGGARCPRIAYTAETSYILLAIVVVVS